jgi:hypothetical protein
VDLSNEQILWLALFWSRHLQRFVAAEMLELKLKRRARAPAPHNLADSLVRATRSDVQVLHIQRVFFDELAASFNVLAHQRGEDGFALGEVFEPDR